jgi:nitric oxide reductase NorQ protein
MTTIQIDVKNSPEYHYVQTELDPAGRDEYRLKFLPNQYIPIAVSSTLEVALSQQDWNVSANKVEINNHPLGSVFKLKSCKLLQSAKVTWAVSSDLNFIELISYEKAEEAIDETYKTINGVTKPVEVETEEIIEPEEAALPADKDDSELTYLELLNKKHKIPSIKKDGFYVSKNTWEQLIRHVDRKKNILITGDSGVGKTELCYFLSSTFGKDLKIHDMGATQDPIASLIGVHRIGDTGKSEFDLASFVDDIQGDNIILMDEINRAPLNTNNILFPLLDRRRSIDLSIASSSISRKVPAHEEAVFIGTANIGAEFTGTNILDEAFKNRFIVVQLDYPPSSVEINLLVNRTGVDKEEARKIVKIASGVRGKKISGDVSTNISIRQTLEIAELVKDGFELLTVLDFYLKPLFGDEYEEVKDIFQGL